CMQVFLYDCSAENVIENSFPTRRSSDLAEDRERVQKLVDQLGLKQPPNRTARSAEEAQVLAREIGYPLVVRPSYVLRGRAMEVRSEEHTSELQSREKIVCSLLLEKKNDD